jgi:anti-sigma-K factor RskA
VSDDLETPEILAGEYVLGLLRGEEQHRFEQQLESDATLRRHVTAWERRLALLADGLPPAQPSPRVWRRVAARIARRPDEGVRGSRTLPLWRALALAASLAVIVLASLLARKGVAPTPVQLALLADEHARPVLMVSAAREGGSVQVRLLRQPETPKGRTLELWLLPEAGGAPRSLGLLSSEGPTRLSLTPEQLHAFATAPGLAVSVEPPGGSPTGAPTGPVVFTGTLQTPL